MGCFFSKYRHESHLGLAFNIYEPFIMILRHELTLELIVDLRQLINWIAIDIRYEYHVK